jgi:hypothetical protein
MADVTAPASGRMPLATALVAALLVALLVGWLPHYLTWPWWPDLDAWATLAQGWDEGRRPYRDVAIFNFPGPIEVAWLIGHAFGWGHTSVTYALDAAFLVGLGGLLAWWSRRQFGGVLPGLIGSLAILRYYADLDYALVAQRDWHAPILALGGLLILRARPGRIARGLSGAAVGLGLAIRPHVILFTPLFLVLLARGSGDPAAGGRGRVGRLGGWTGAALIALALAFAPLLWQGLLGDFWAGVRKASYGARYSTVTPGSVAVGIWTQLGLSDLGAAFATPAASASRAAAWRFDLIAIALAAAALAGPSARRESARVWLLGMALVLLYEPLHPKRHAYLAHPRHLVSGVALAFVAGLLFEATRARPRIRAAWVALLILAAAPGPPRFWRPLASLRSLGTLLRPEVPRVAPPGCEAHFYPADRRSPYDWTSYRDALNYLRDNTDGSTLVANLLANLPFPSFNGPIGRASPLPGESGVIWLWSVEPDLEPRYAEAIAATPSGTVAVWDPGRPSFDERLRLPNVARVVRRQFRPEARFGSIEVWRKP